MQHALLLCDVTNAQGTIACSSCCEVIDQHSICQQQAQFTVMLPLCPSRDNRLRKSVAGDLPSRGATASLFLSRGSKLVSFAILPMHNAKFPRAAVLVLGDANKGNIASSPLASTMLVTAAVFATDNAARVRATASWICVSQVCVKQVDSNH